MAKRTYGEQPQKRLRYLVVARTHQGPWPHPIEVRVQPDGPRSQVSFSLGPHAANVGGVVPLSRVLDDRRTGLDPTFAEEFDAAGLDWLVPLLVRLHAGEDVTEEIIESYRAEHGTYPDEMS